jgi:hypothetical protein
LSGIECLVNDQREKQFDKRRRNAYKRSMKNANAADKLLADALARVESASIRAWATSAHNHPLFKSEAQARVEKGRTDPTAFATAIVCLAIGL